MDVESADMLTALRRQIQPHLMMAALTPSQIPSVQATMSGTPLNYSIPLSTFMMHVSTL